MRAYSVREMHSLRISRTSRVLFEREIGFDPSSPKAHALRTLNDGMSAYREGNIIDLGFTQLQVVDACSGLRYLFPLIALACLLAYHFRYRFWKGAVLVLFAIPVTIVTNSLRLASVGVLYPFFGKKVAEGFFHDFSGWLIFMASLALLLVVVWGLNRLAPEDPRSAVLQPPAPAGLPVHPYHSVVAVVLLLITLVVFWGVEFRETITINRPLRDLPLTVGEWTGVPSVMDAQTLAELNLSDYTILDYRDGRGKEVNVYVAYNESQRKGKSTHSPDSCLPGSGWIFHDSGTTLLRIRADEAPMQVSRAFMEKSGSRQLSYYWFPQ
jgi:exosortase D (VPLPA-CTERM-specific)